jgi:hypothetical protein
MSAPILFGAPYSVYARSARRALEEVDVFASRRPPADEGRRATQPCPAGPLRPRANDRS